MKKLFFAIAFAAVCLGAFASNTVIRSNQLPSEVKTFIAKHFSGYLITLAEKDNDSYDVKLSNGWELEFTLKGAIKEVDCKNAAVPASVVALIPSAISSYVNTNYPGTSIVEISKGKDYEIELNNGVELDFSLNGDFIKVD